MDMIIQNLLKNYDTVSKLITFLQSYGMLLIVIFLLIELPLYMLFPTMLTLTVYVPWFKLYATLALPFESVLTV